MYGQRSRPLQRQVGKQRKRSASCSPIPRTRRKGRREFVHLVFYSTLFKYTILVNFRFETSLAPNIVLNLDFPFIWQCFESIFIFHPSCIIFGAPLVNCVIVTRMIALNFEEIPIFIPSDSLP